MLDVCAHRRPSVRESSSLRVGGNRRTGGRQVILASSCCFYSFYLFMQLNYYTLFIYAFALDVNMMGPSRKFTSSFMKIP